VQSPLSPRHGYCRPFASFNGSPGSFEQVGRRKATAGCSEEDGKSAQGNGGLSIRNGDAGVYRSEERRSSKIPSFCVRSLHSKVKA